MNKLLTIKEVSEFLQVNERTLHRLIQSNKIPATKVGNQWRFHPAQLETWFLNGGKNQFEGNGATLENKWEEEEEFHIVSSDRILIDLDVRTPSEVIDHMVDTLVESGHLLQKQIFLQAVLDRENHTPTAIGNGVALPHAWHPINDLFHAPLVVSARLKTPVDFKAIDKAPVDLVFLLCSPRNKMHLRLLSTMAAAAKDTAFLASLRSARNESEFREQLMQLLSPLSHVSY